MDTNFEEFDHCGDVGIEARGTDTANALEYATLGLFSLMVRGDVSALVERTLTVKASSEADLVVDWLSEVIAVAGTNGEVYCDVEIDSMGPWAVRGVIRGEPIDEGRHELRFDVKAATYHGLECEHGSEGCRLRVIFDL
jgi:SHS2 domain-containing protein